MRAADIHNLLGGDDLEIIDVPDLKAANQVLKARRVDGVVLDWVLPESEGIEFIERIQASSTLPVPPVVVSGSRRLTEQQVTAIHRCARSGPVRYAPTIERVLDETVLLLHRRKARSPENSGAFWPRSANPIRCWPDVRCW